MKGISFTHGKKVLNFYPIVILFATTGDRFEEEKPFLGELSQK